MSVTSVARAVLQSRKPSRVPGGFETDNDADLDVEDDEHTLHRTQHSTDMASVRTGSVNTPQPWSDDESTEPLRLEAGDLPDSSTIDLSHDDDEHSRALVNNTVLEEQEMNRRLNDFESSFVPELSHLSIGQASFQQDKSRLAISQESMQTSTRIEQNGLSTVPASGHDQVPAILVRDDSLRIDGSSSALQSPKTPPGMYRTPAPEMQQQRLHEHEHERNDDKTSELPDTSALEQMSFSRSAERTVSRVQSMATIGGYETADERDFPESPTKKMSTQANPDLDATPRKKKGLAREGHLAEIGLGSVDAGALSVARRRPKYLSSRSSHARLSFDSIASSNTETSEVILGADFALQSGGAAPEARLQRKPRMTLSRSTSLGSIVSGVSNMSDDESSQSRKNELSTLQEETPSRSEISRLSPNAAMITPKASTANMAIPTDTVVANHVRELEVPGSFARQYRQLNPIVSPEKPLGITAMTPGPKKGLTLKEHRSTVEKLGKENFDLKMKIHFLDQALQRRSEDGVKEMITENVQLKSDRMRLEKDNHTLRKQVRDLQKKLDSLDTDGARDSPSADQGYGTDEDRSPTVEEELIYLRERIETSELEVERLRTENIAKESEKRRLAELVRNLGDTRATVSDVGSREERDMWKDMLESETIAREQSEEENKKLRDEVAKLRQDTFNSGNRPRHGRVSASVVSRSSSNDGPTAVKSDNAETERLRHEVSELQKMISAQASTLTSRNKEKERLYQEIEDLKIGRLSGVRSIAGDSIFDRSASRARSNSRASNATRLTRLSEPEREQFEVRIGELRDEVSQLKLDNQNLQNDFDQALAELDALDQQVQDDLNAFQEEMSELVQERNNLLNEVEQQDNAFQQLKAEAQEEIDGLGDELDAKMEECARLDEELKAQTENVDALQNEIRATSEGLARLEADSQQSMTSYQGVKSQLDDVNRELQRTEQSLSDADAKVQRLTVEQESSHNEIAFLREEQDADKIKIGDLESLLKKTHLNLDAEREKIKDLERRLNEERAQRDNLSSRESKEKQEVQRMISELNREATSAKDELRRVRKALSTRDLEAATHKDRLSELEEGLRKALREPNGTRASLLTTISKLQRDLESTTNELDVTSKRLDDHQNLLANRDGLLESSGLEYRKLADLLERERQARRQDKHSFEQSLKSHQQAARALSTNNTRIAELEQARAGHRKQVSQLEAQFKDQLAERNQILLTIWKKLSVLCGHDWVHNHSLINGNLPSQEVVGNMLFWPGFSRNLLLAAKQVEGTFSLLKDKIKRSERELWKEYQNLEHQLAQRSKKLERIEEMWEKMKLRQQEMEAGINIPHSHSRPRTSRDPAIQKLTGENRMLKAELQLLQQHNTHSNGVRPQDRSASRASGLSGVSAAYESVASMDGAAGAFGGGIPHRHSSIHQNTAHQSELVRHNSSANELHSRHNPAMSGRNHSDREQWTTGSNSPDGAYPSHRHSLAVPSRTFVDPQPPASGNFARPPVLSPLPQLVPSNTQSRPTSSINGTVTSMSNVSDAATITTAQLMGFPDNQAQWIHRLRELERRLKHEREQRLVDRTGMRKRLEEREAVNEELRRELERERIRHSFDGAEDEGGVNGRA